MANQLPSVRSTATLPAVDLSQPAGMLTLPPWLADRINAVSDWGKGIRRDGREVPTLPTSLTLTGAMRTSLTERIKQLEAAGAPGPEEDTLLVIAKLLTFYAGRGTTEAQAAVKTEVYAEVCADVPAWALDEARRRWHRKDAGAPAEDYRFAPDPEVWRSLAARIAAASAGQAIRLRRLLLAEPYDPPSPEEAARLAADAKATMERLAAHAQRKAGAKGKQESPQEALARLKARADEPMAFTSEALKPRPSDIAAKTGEAA